MTPYDDVKVVILGQDPYPNPGEAHGLAFSVPTEVSWKPDSLRNIHKVLVSDLSTTLGRPVTTPERGSLEGWAQQGVLLLNTALTVRAGTKTDRKAHRQWRWEGQGRSTFTDAVIKAVNDKHGGDPDEQPVLGCQQGTDEARPRRDRLGASRTGRLTGERRHATGEHS